MADDVTLFAYALLISSVLRLTTYQPLRSSTLRRADEQKVYPDFFYMSIEFSIDLSSNSSHEAIEKGKPEKAQHLESADKTELGLSDYDEGFVGWFVSAFHINKAKPANRPAGHFH